MLEDASMIDPSRFDRATFTNQPFLKRIEKPWGYEILFTESDLPYAGKILHIDAGKRLSLQMHDEKQETQFLVSGRCMRIADNEKGDLVEIEMEPGKGYTIMKGQRHRLQGITDCDVFEVSTPEIGTTYRLQDDYKRPDETEQMRTEERRD
jgi:mannose-6-phosphate isomerase-like protein (cupin superfamily)